MIMILMNAANEKVVVTLDQLRAYCEHLGEKGLCTFNEYACALTGGGLVSAAIFVVLMGALAYLFYKKGGALNWCDRNLTYAFVIVWILGFVVYDVGMYPDHSVKDNAFWALLGVAPMAVIHAFGMFILQSDVSAIHEGCHNSAWFMFFFSIAHLLAAFISMVFVIKHFGFNIVAHVIRVYKTYFWPKEKENLYIFWGMNDATYYLAKDIINPKDSNNTHPDARIMIIRVNNAKEDPNKRIGMDRLFSFLSLSNNNLDNLQELQKMGCLTNSTFGSLTDIQASNKNDLIKRELRLNSVAKLMNRTTGKVHMFFLDDNEAFNLQAIGNLKRDTTINKFINEEDRKVIFYCHARHNSIHRVIEDEPSHQNIEVKVIDSSHLSVEQLKLPENIHLQPVRYVDIEDDATVSSAFKALVIGFSEVGLDMVRFLYEFGAFVKYKKKDENAPKNQNVTAEGTEENPVDRSDFHCYVVDKEMNSLSGSFVSKTPSINVAINPTSEQEYQDALISLHHIDCKSAEFYRKVENWLPTINYIVLATGDDELNMSQAIRLFKLAIRYNNTSRLRIMVRVQNDENGHFQRIAHHYNRLWAAERRSTPKENKMNQKVIHASTEINGPITLFGSAEKIYTFDHIINESLKESAKKFREKYDNSLNNHLKEMNEEPNEIISWEEEQNRAMQLVDNEYKNFSPTYSGIMGLRRKQSQNYANSLHIKTKVVLACTALNIDANLGLCGLIRQGETTYKWDGENNPLPIETVQRVMDVLAQTEHLRWVATHEIHGYQIDNDNPKSKDEARLFQRYMCNWNKLTPRERSYDYNTIDVSFQEAKLINEPNQ